MKCALYARCSTGKQSRASVEDQHRLCEQIAQRQGFTFTARFSDAAISGGTAWPASTTSSSGKSHCRWPTAHRPGYQKMLAAARRQEFDAIVAEDSSRLWRHAINRGGRMSSRAKRHRKQDMSAPHWAV